MIESGRVVILGTGTMAAGIAAGFIDAAIPVVVLGRSVEKALKTIDSARQLAAVLRMPPKTDTAATAGLMDT